MASRQFTSKARRGRNRAPSRRRTRSIRPIRKGSDHEPEPAAFGSLRARIENERGELLRAASVLGCLYSALLYSERDEDPTWYADVAQVARRLVQDSVNRLDSVYIGPLTKRIWKASKRKQLKRAAAGRQGQSS